MFNTIADDCTRTRNLFCQKLPLAPDQQITIFTRRTFLTSCKTNHLDFSNISTCTPAKLFAKLKELSCIKEDIQKRVVAHGGMQTVTVFFSMQILTNPLSQN